MHSSKSVFASLTECGGWKNNFAVVAEFGHDINMWKKLETSCTQCGGGNMGHTLCVPRPRPAQLALFFD